MLSSVGKHSDSSRSSGGGRNDDKKSGTNALTSFLFGRPLGTALAASGHLAPVAASPIGQGVAGDPQLIGRR